MSDTLATPWTVARQVPLSMGFSRQEYWSGLLFPSPGDLPNPGIEPRSPALQADSLPAELPGKPRAKGGTCQSLAGRQATISLVRGEGRGEKSLQNHNLNRFPFSPFPRPFLFPCWLPPPLHLALVSLSSLLGMVIPGLGHTPAR